MFSWKREAMAAQSANRATQPAIAPSIISADVAVIGTITVAGEIQVDGRIDGNVYCESLVIGATGRIYGAVFATRVTIRGDFKGHIRTQKLHLCATSHVEGDILYGTWVVEAGARFAGSGLPCDDPLAEMRKPVAPPSEPAPAMLAAAE